MKGPEPILVPYEKARTQIRNADQLLFRRRSIISIAGRGIHSHAAKAVWWGADLFCVEIRELKGGRAVTLPSHVRRYRVELWAIAKADHLLASGKEIDTAGMTVVRLKAPGDVLDIATLTAAVSGWCFRTLWFRAFCMGTKPLDKHLGRLSRPDPADLDQVSRDPKRILVRNVWSHDAAVDLICRTIDQVAGGATC